jgi:hypothetical protein
VRNDVAGPPGMTKAELLTKNQELRAALAAQEAALL